MSNSVDEMRPEDYTGPQKMAYRRGFADGFVARWAPLNHEHTHAADEFDREALEYAQRHPRDPDCAKLLHEYGRQVLALEAEQLAKGIHPSQLSSRIEFIEPKATDW